MSALEKKVYSLIDLFDAIYGLEKLGIQYTVESVQNEKHWIVKVIR